MYNLSLPLKHAASPTRLFAVKTTWCWLKPHSIACRVSHNSPVGICVSTLVAYNAPLTCHVIADIDWILEVHVIRNIPEACIPLQLSIPSSQSAADQLQPSFIVAVGGVLLQTLDSADSPEHDYTSCVLGLFALPTTVILRGKGRSSAALSAY